jgi:hypothetical protein
MEDSFVIDLEISQYNLATWPEIMQVPNNKQWNVQLECPALNIQSTISNDEEAKNVEDSSEGNPEA